MKTDTVSNTAFRGFGGPQGKIGGERVIEEIAYALGKDPLEVRKANFYGIEERNVTPYHQVVEDNIIHRIVDELETSDYQARREAIARPQRRQAGAAQGHRADAGQVRHLVHRHLVQPGRCPGAHLPGRFDPPQSRRHGDGPGPQHQGGAGGRRRVPGGHRDDPHHRDQHRQGAEHLGDRRLLRLRPQRHGGGQCLRTDQDPADRLRVRAFRGSGGTGGLRSQPCAGRQPAHPLPELVRQAYTHRVQLSAAGSTRRRKSTGTARRARAGRSSTSPMARRFPK